MAGIPHPSPLSEQSYSAAELSLDNTTLLLLDQRLLPGEERYEAIQSAEQAARAISDMVMRVKPSS